MKYLGQITIIMVISLLGDILNEILPFPVPGSIYGFIIMFLCLQFNIVKLHKVKDVGDFLLDIMPVMFVPATVGIIVIWGKISQDILQILITSILTTVIVMVITGKAAEFVLKRTGEKNEGSN